MVSADHVCDPGVPTRLLLHTVNRRLRAAFTYMGDSDCNTINGCALPASPMLSFKAKIAKGGNGTWKKFGRILTVTKGFIR